MITIYGVEDQVTRAALGAFIDRAVALVSVGVNVDAMKFQRLPALKSWWTHRSDL